MASHPLPTELRLHQQSRVLEILFDDGARFELPCEFLRVHSPSAEVRGHAPGLWNLHRGKQGVNILELRRVGNYAVKIRFDDGHDSGLFDWRYLYRLGRHQAKLWALYQARLNDPNQRATWPDPFATLEEASPEGPTAS